MKAFFNHCFWLVGELHWFFFGPRWRWVLWRTLLRSSRTRTCNCGRWSRNVKPGRCRTSTPWPCVSTESSTRLSTEVSLAIRRLYIRCIPSPHWCKTTSCLKNVYTLSQGCLPVSSAREHRAFRWPKGILGYLRSSNAWLACPKENISVVTSLYTLPINYRNSSIERKIFPLVKPWENL